MSFSPGIFDRGASRSGRLGGCVFAWGLASCLVAAGAIAAEDATTVERRLADSAKVLSADDYEGRGVGTKGLDRAADYLAEQFRQIGLKTDLFDGGPFQKFQMTTGAELGPKEKNKLILQGPPTADGKPGAKIELTLGKDFNPLAMGGSGNVDLPLVFVGYGITGKTEKYDDYAGIDVKDKAVVILRREPQQGNPHSAFNGTQHSPHAPFWRKVSNAYEHGAAAVIFCDDEYQIRENVERQRKALLEAIDALSDAQAKFKATPQPTLEQTDAFRKRTDELTERIRGRSERIKNELDPLLAFDGAGLEGAGRKMPIVHVRRSALNQMIKPVLGRDLSQLETAIDEGPKPQSGELTGWKITGEVSVGRKEADVKNVVAVLEGEGPLADETIIIGAHYDHLGFGGAGSFSASKEIHNGADDNASGTTTLLEVARQIAGRGKKLPRRIVFIAFTGEERGLIGSAKYVQSPLFPLEKTVAMLNMDMVGRLTDDKLIIEGPNTAAEFPALLDKLNEKYAFKITKKAGGSGPSDHASFYPKKIPVMHFFTGLHLDYHRPSDDFEKLNISGMRRVGEFVMEVAVALAEAEKRPTFQESKAAATVVRGDGARPYFGSIPDFSQTVEGYAISGVTKDGPAEKGGLKGGDVIIRLGDSKIGNLEDFDNALRKFKAGDKAPIVVKRGGDEVKLEVTLEPPK